MRISDMIVADSTGKEKGFLSDSVTIDIDIGDSDDFEMELPLSEYLSLGYKLGDRIYIPGTEYGGLIEEKETITLEDRVFLRGYTWRGLLRKKVIRAGNGTGMTVSGEANAVLRTLTDGWLEPLARIDDSDSGIQIGSYEFSEPIEGLEGISEMLKAVGAKLELVYTQQQLTGEVVIRAVPIEDYSDEIEYSNDQKVHFTTKEYARGTNHLVCVGEDEAGQAMTVDLYVDENGEVSENQTYYGYQEKAELYQSSSKEKAKLIEEGTKKLTELDNYVELEMSVQDLEVAVGDIVGGRDRITGLYLRQPIAGKILKLDCNSETIEYKVGE